MFRSVFIAVLASLLPAAGSAQQVIAPRLKTRVTPSVSPYRSGQLERAVVVDLDGDCAPDLAYRRGDQVHVAAHPEIWGWFETTNVSGVSDIAPLASPCGQGSDAVLAVGPAGVRVLTYEDPQFYVFAVAGWDEVRTIRAASNGSSFLLAGVDGTGSTLLIGAWLPGQSQITTTATVTTTGIQEVIFADWDNNGSIDVVVRIWNGVLGGLVAYDLAGIQLGSSDDFTTASAGSVARIETTAGDQVAWLAWDAVLGDWELRQLQGGSQFLGVPLTLAPEFPANAAAVNIAAGDYDGDGNDDLVYYASDSTYLALFRHRGGLVGFGLDQYHLVGTDPLDPVFDLAPVVFADVNNDSRDDGGNTIAKTADLILPVQSQESFKFFTGLRDAVDGVGGPEPDEEYPVILPETQPPTIGAGGLKELEMELHVPEQFAWATHLQVVKWWHPTPKLSEDFGLENPTYLFDVSPPPPQGPHTVTVTITLEHPLQGAQWTKDEVYYLSIRFLDVPEPCVIVESSPTYLFGVTVDQSSSFSGLLDYYLRTISNNNPASEGPIGVARHVGAIKKRNLRPPTTSGSMPQVPLTCN